jgi:hypothetical protein
MIRIARGERACCDLVERDRRTRRLSSVQHRRRDVPANHANQCECESLKSTLLAKTFGRSTASLFRVHSRALLRLRSRLKRSPVHRSLLTSHFFPPPGTPVALMRAARDGSMPSVMLTVIPGFKSAMLARCPFTVISVNCVIVSVLVVFLSLTVIALPVTLEMTGW